MSLSEPVIFFLTTLVYLGFFFLLLWSLYSVVTSLRSIAQSQQQMATIQAEILKTLNKKEKF
ncbi:hypothetical protein [Marinicella gelatinilytica]|uniref:hypothetical protein n=1 Tax=Marinicella gelatinilytica TaxID=2996017 RepID=UPI0022608FA4|nr:hypothetical protein [Marinicella gelatinilytica]MCX7544017.1 hypothetical protein [Marinicella gelatinilytica]